MNMIQLKCPNCNADLDVENNIDSFYCKYCGTKILLDGQDAEVLKTKRHAKTMDSLKDMQKEYYNEQQRRDEESKKNSMRAGLVLIIGFIFIFLFVYLGKLLF